MSNHLIDTDLLGKIEQQPEAYFNNSGHRVKEFLGCWTVTLINNIEAVGQAKDDQYIANYLADQHKNLKRIERLQKAQEIFENTGQLPKGINMDQIVLLDKLMKEKEEELLGLLKQVEQLYENIRAEEDSIRESYKRVDDWSKQMNELDHEARKLKKELYGEED